MFEEMTMYPLLLVRYGELGLKGRNRRAFEDRLLANMRRAIREVPHGEIKRTFGRIYLETKGNWEELAAKLQRVFGIVSLSPCCAAASIWRRSRKGPGWLPRIRPAGPSKWKPGGPINSSP